MVLPPREEKHLRMSNSTNVICYVQEPITVCLVNYFLYISLLCSLNIYSTACRTIGFLDCRIFQNERAKVKETFHLLA